MIFVPPFFEFWFGKKDEEACPKLEESERLDPGSGTLLNLGDCYEHVGRTASAWSTFLEAAAAAKSSGNSMREHVARDRAAAVAGTLSRIEIDVPKTSLVPGLVVTRDGKTVKAPTWGTATPIDPGKHQVSATAPGHDRWDTEVSIEAGGSTQSVVVPAFAASAAEPAPETPASSAVAPDRNPPAEGSRLGAQKVLSLVAGGIGVVGIGVGTVFGLQSKSKHDEAVHHCDGSACRDQTGVDLKSQAIKAGNFATVGFAVGVAGLVGGTALWLTAGGEREKPTTERWDSRRDQSPSRGCGDLSRHAPGALA